MINSVTAYHQRSKHSLQRYASGPETLDWDDQPNPFRYFDGCPIQPLPKPGKDLAVTWAQLDQRQAIPASELNLDHLGLMLELAFGLSAWKQFGPDRWSLRNNPSSGNLHPTEVYLVNTITELMPQGVYHYVSYEHQLEQRCRFEKPALQQDVLIGLSSIYWREAWKYGERAYRYCQLDAGHALAALSYAAAALGWRVELLSEYSDSEISCLLGLDKGGFVEGELETPDLICRIHYNDIDRQPDFSQDRSALLQAVQQASWQGSAQSLGAYHMYQWPVIDEVSKAAQKKHQLQRQWLPQSSVAVKSDCSVPVSQLIRQRRSAQRFNAQAIAIKQQAFFRILDALSAADKPPFDAWNWPPAVHLCLFVHKVEGLLPGLYCLPRSAAALDTLTKQLNSEFKWQAVEAFPSLYLLLEGDVRLPAKTLSCHQPIASDSTFSLAMLAEFNDIVAEHAWYYRRLFWECGLLGQVLYMEAEAAGLRGTGIGCFFDDDVHDILGIEGDNLQSLYHFTLGEALEDHRIQTFSAYAHLNRAET